MRSCSSGRQSAKTGPGRSAAARQHEAPRIDDHRAAVGEPAAGVLTALRGREDVALVPRSPVRAAAPPSWSRPSRARNAAGTHSMRAPALHEGAVELRESARRSRPRGRPRRTASRSSRAGRPARRDRTLDTRRRPASVRSTSKRWILRYTATISPLGATATLVVRDARLVRHALHGTCRPISQMRCTRAPLAERADDLAVRAAARTGSARRSRRKYAKFSGSATSSAPGRRRAPRTSRRTRDSIRRPRSDVIWTTAARMGAEGNQRARAAVSVGNSAGSTPVRRISVVEVLAVLLREPRAWLMLPSQSRRRLSTLARPRTRASASRNEGTRSALTGEHQTPRRRPPPPPARSHRLAHGARAARTRCPPTAREQRRARVGREAEPASAPPSAANCARKCAASGSTSSRRSAERREPRPPDARHRAARRRASVPPSR
jgi:hypothetical protein